VNEVKQEYTGTTEKIDSKEEYQHLLLKQKKKFFQREGIQRLKKGKNPGATKACLSSRKEGNNHEKGGGELRV